VCKLAKLGVRLHNPPTEVEPRIGVMHPRSGEAGGAPCLVEAALVLDGLNMHNEELRTMLVCGSERASCSLSFLCFFRHFFMAFWPAL
jgi:hypothetical protein